MEDFKQRRTKFDQYLKKHPLKISAKGSINYTCPCCGFPTINRRKGCDICILCMWEDDGQDDKNADEITGGSNGFISLSEARNNYKKYRYSYYEDETPDSYKEVANQLIILYYQLLDVNNYDDDIIEKIDRCFIELNSIILEEIRKLNEATL